MSAYIGRTYTMTVSGTVSRRERCAIAFEYEICRDGMGNGHSPFLLFNFGARQTAERRARKALQRAFVGAVEPVHCPTCGMYQPEMVPELERRFGVRFDPNEHAAERVTIPFNVLWKKMVETYEQFMRIWPRHADHAKLRLRELRHPVRRKVLRVLSWTVWGIIAVGFAGLVLLSIVGEHKVIKL